MIISDVHFIYYNVDVFNDTLLFLILLTKKFDHQAQNERYDDCEHYGKYENGQLAIVKAILLFSCSRYNDGTLLTARQLSQVAVDRD